MHPLQKKCRSAIDQALLAAREHVHHVAKDAAAVPGRTRDATILKVEEKKEEIQAPPPKIHTD